MSVTLADTFSNKMFKSSSYSLNEQQQRAFSALQLGQNVLLTGPAGTGKSHLIKAFQDWVKQTTRYNIAVTSTTGTSALLIGGVTLHSWAGIGLGKEKAPELTATILKKHWLRKRWNDVNILIIDEISMMDPDLFDKLDYVAKVVRNSSLPFGGIQLILTGDFCQLKPVKKGQSGQPRKSKDNTTNSAGSAESEEDRFCFEAKSWNNVVQHVYHFTEIVRQKDKAFQKCLNACRMGNLTEEDKALLESR